MQDNRRSYSPPASAPPPAPEAYGAPRQPYPPQQPYAQQPSQYPPQQPYSQPEYQAQQQPSYAPPASMPPQREEAVVVRRGRPREGRDLFATQAEDLGNMVQNDDAKPGVRGENSVLFTLDSLRSTSSPQSQSAPAPVGNSGYPTHNPAQPSYGQPPYSAPPGAVGYQAQSYQGQAGAATQVPGSGYPVQGPYSSRAPADDESTGTIDLIQMARDGGTSLKVKPVALLSSTFAEYMPKPVVAAPQVTANSSSIGAVLALGGLAAAVVLGLLGGGLWYLKASALPASPGLAATANAEIVVAEISHIAKLPKGDADAMAGSKGPVRSGARTFSGSASISKGTSGSSGTSGSRPPVARPKAASDPCHCGGVLACVMRCSATGK